MKHQIIMKKSHWKYRNVFQNHGCQAWLPYGKYNAYPTLWRFALKSKRNRTGLLDSRYSFSEWCSDHVSFPLSNLLQYVYIYIYLYLSILDLDLRACKTLGLGDSELLCTANIRILKCEHWIETQEWLALWFSYPKSLVGILSMFIPAENDR